MPANRIIAAFIVALVGLALASCANQPPARTTTYVFYDCADAKSFIATFYPDSRADLVIEGKRITLLQQPSGSGIRYSDGHTTLFGKGDDAFVEIDGTRAYDGCRGLKN
jgi:membrane-bound inhibitor of C-type lysozyme